MLIPKAKTFQNEATLSEAIYVDGIETALFDVANGSFVHNTKRSSFPNNANFVVVAFLSDSGDGKIYQMHAGGLGEPFLIAGASGPGYQDGPLLQSRFRNPSGMCLSYDGNFLFVADRSNHAVRRIDLQSKTVRLFAGTAGKSGLIDGDPQKSRFFQPSDVAIDERDNVYVADTGGY